MEDPPASVPEGGDCRFEPAPLPLQPVSLSDTCSVLPIKVHHHFKVSEEKQPLSAQDDPQVLV